MVKISSLYLAKFSAFKNSNNSGLGWKLHFREQSDIYSYICIGHSQRQPLLEMDIFPLSAGGNTYFDLSE